jgi:hypothetical protein
MKLIYDDKVIVLVNYSEASAETAVRGGTPLYYYTVAAMQLVIKLGNELSVNPNLLVTKERLDIVAALVLQVVNKELH